MCQRRNIDLFPDEAIDHILDGEIRVVQSISGYRFSIDSLLLADFALSSCRGLLIDLGTGCGIISLIILKRNASLKVIGVDIQGELISQATRNASLNGLSDRFLAIQADIRSMPLKGGIADGILSNPPFRKLKAGLISPDKRKAIARTELMLTLDELLEAAHYLLRSKGRLYLVYPAGLFVDLTQRLRRKGLEPKRARFQHPEAEGRAELVVVEAQKGARPGILFEAPIFGQGPYSNTFRS